MILCVYILQSKQLNRFYIGYSSNIDLRLEFHKYPDTRKFTSNSKDWILYYKIDCTTKSQALAIEAHIKRMKSKVYIVNLIKHPEITTKLLEKYRDC
ncbi:GIY-YIG nuclease family protein [Xanthomarina gelatinilytica]|uniref:GIY-YIG nuclease family protein n=1 Tax=Xanthomarina gelatinilytica TaxID=1137281 RepID=UPI003AA96C2F